jgi:23S rRNA (adenine2503-C2)-methyltransferase
MSNARPMRALTDHNPQTLAEALRENGHNPANARRILQWLWENDGLVNVEQFPIAKAARGYLGTIPTMHSRVAHRHASADGTIKLLVEFPQSQNADPKSQIPPAVECVLMPSHRPDRAAACISSQVGCAMGCDFCASTRNGLERNLSTGEIVEQFMHLRAEAHKLGRRIASLVFMGMGEPLQNLEQVIPAVQILAEPGLGSLGKRAITVSTVGVVPGIDRLAEADLGVHLALSLHAPDDATRSRLVPMNRRWSVAEIMAAARRYQDLSGRPVNVEYCMLAGVNDSDEQAHWLAERMADFRAHVNLIPYNTIGQGISGAVYQRPSLLRMTRFAEILKSCGVVVHIRQTRGDDVAAACGQLRETAVQVRLVRSGG